MVHSTVNSLKKIYKKAVKSDLDLNRLEKLVKTLDKVSAEILAFLHLVEKEDQEKQKLELRLSKDHQTGCLGINELIGRGQEKDFIMQWLRRPTNEGATNEDPTNEDRTHIPCPASYKNISLLSIVSHGGMGKTTLLKNIFEDLKEGFELKKWVCVSNDFEAKKVIFDMLEFLNNKMPRLEALAALQVSLKTVVHSKRFLLFLDDIWEEDVSKWEDVLSPLLYGSFGSKILLTTRMDSIAAMISNVLRKKKETLKLNGLEEDMCLKLLNTHAFADEENLDSHKKLADIASLIIKKLSGSPLLARSIGKVLNSGLRESFWTNILNSNVPNAKSELGHDNILGHIPHMSMAH